MGPYSGVSLLSILQNTIATKIPKSTAKQQKNTKTIANKYAFFSDESDGVALLISHEMLKLTPFNEYFDVVSATITSISFVVKQHEEGDMYV